MSLTRYSRRVPWHNTPNAIATAIQAFRSAGRELLDLTVSNPTLVGLAYPHEEIRQAFAEIRDFTYEADPLGLPAARDAICGYYEQRGISVSPEQVVCTASTSEAYGLLFKLFCEAGDQILCPVPSYPLFEYLAGGELVETVSYRLSYDGAWFIDLGQLSESVTPRSRALILVNPNNPTGSCLRRAEWDLLVPLMQQMAIPVISDEVFMDFAFQADEGTMPTLAGRQDTLSFSLSGLSKCACMPQMKLGWVVINGPEQARTQARDRLELLLDTYLSVNTPVQLATQRLLEIGRSVQQPLLVRIRENLRSAGAELANSAAHVLRTQGGWSGIIQLPGFQKDEEWALQLLDKANVLVQPGYFFDLPVGAYVVISLITSPDIFREGLARIRRLLDEAASM